MVARRQRTAAQTLRQPPSRQAPARPPTQRSRGPCSEAGPAALQGPALLQLDRQQEQHPRTSERWPHSRELFPLAEQRPALAPAAAAVQVRWVMHPPQYCWTTRRWQRLKWAPAEDGGSTGGGRFSQRAGLWRGGEGASGRHRVTPGTISSLCPKNEHAARGHCHAFYIVVMRHVSCESSGTLLTLCKALLSTHDTFFTRDAGLAFPGPTQHLSHTLSRNCRLIACQTSHRCTAPSFVNVPAAKIQFTVTVSTYSLLRVARRGSATARCQHPP